MKYFAVLYRLDALNQRQELRASLVGMTGDRSVFRLDGRLSVDSMLEAGLDWAKKHGADGFRIERGASLLSLQPYTKMVRLC
jgi:hypothetical protein